jgi:hypothetical protein
MPETMLSRELEGKILDETETHAAAIGRKQRVASTSTASFFTPRCSGAELQSRTV